MIQWYWHDGSSFHLYDDVCNAVLENGFRRKANVVAVRVTAGCVHTVHLGKTPMRVAENDATVLRISDNMYVVMSTTLYYRTHSTVRRSLCHSMRDTSR